MNKWKLILICIIICTHVFAQNNYEKSLQTMQECMAMSTTDRNTTLKLYENLGVLESINGNLIQRIKLSDIEKVLCAKKETGFTVDIICNGMACITIMKNENTSEVFPSTGYLFTHPAVANTFAKHTEEIINKFKTDNEKVAVVYLSTPDGKTPMMNEKPAPSKEAIAKKENANTAIEEPEEVDTDEKADVSKNKKNAKTAVEKPETKVTKRNKRKSDKEESDNEDNDTQDPVENNRVKAKRNSIIEDVDDTNDDGSKSKAGNSICTQLLQIVESGKETQFKSIEGAASSDDQKINESKIKLRGARKNYLSWYKKQRAFIAEIKTGSNYEQLYKEYENMLNTLDECLGAGWENEDKSNSEDYAKLKSEVKDMEFKKENTENTPTIRVIFVENNGKFTLFVRVQ